MFPGLDRAAIDRPCRAMALGVHVCMRAALCEKIRPFLRRFSPDRSRCYREKFGGEWRSVRRSWEGPRVLFFSALSALGGADMSGKILGASSASADTQKQQKPANQQAFPNRSLEMRWQTLESFIGRK